MYTMHRTYDLSDLQGIRCHITVMNYDQQFNYFIMQRFFSVEARDLKFESIRNTYMFTLLIANPKTSSK